jgi:hypothetical protein
MAGGHERAHAEILGQGEGLPVVGLALLDIGGVGVGVDGAKLAERQCLVSALPILPRQVKRLACVLLGLVVAFRQEAGLAESRDMVGISV